jgi:hypothetical protein
MNMDNSDFQTSESIPTIHNPVLDIDKLNTPWLLLVGEMNV